MFTSQGNFDFGEQPDRSHAVPDPVTRWVPTDAHVFWSAFLYPALGSFPQRPFDQKF